MTSGRSAAASAWTCPRMATATVSWAVSWGPMCGSVRFTPWHNDLLYTDIKWRTELLLQDSVGVSGADIGFVGSLRFRVTNHFDVFADFLPVGVRYSGGDTYPLIGILGSGCSLGVLYRF